MEPQERHFSLSEEWSRFQGVIHSILQIGKVPNNQPTPRYASVTD